MVGSCETEAPACAVPRVFHHQPRGRGLLHEVRERPRRVVCGVRVRTSARSGLLHEVRASGGGAD